MKWSAPGLTHTPGAGLSTRSAPRRGAGRSPPGRISTCARRWRRRTRAARSSAVIFSSSTSRSGPAPDRASNGSPQPPAPASSCRKTSPRRAVSVHLAGRSCAARRPGVQDVARRRARRGRPGGRREVTAAVGAELEGALRLEEAVLADQREPAAELAGAARIGQVAVALDQRGGTRPRSPRSGCSRSSRPSCCRRRCRPGSAGRPRSRRGTRGRRTAGARRRSRRC